MHNLEINKSHVSKTNLPNGPIKVNQKMAFFGSEIWKPEKLNFGSGWELGIENLGFKPEIQCIFQCQF